MDSYQDVIQDLNLEEGGIAGWIEDSTLLSTFLMPKAVKFPQILLKVYIKCQISSSANLVNTMK